MDIVEIINKKRLGIPLEKDEIDYAFLGYLNNKIEVYQMSALLMAICLNGMNEEETFTLTDVFIQSGSKIDLSELIGVTADKHSTGGIGDKTTLIIAPMVATCGVYVPKMSGKGLGYTGGTIDKLHSIKGFDTELSNDDFIMQLKDIGVVICSQGDIVPLDKKIYELRDVTGCVESVPLIASSIMSKKILCGANNIVIDIKLGNGALIKTRDDATKLADLMKKIGNRYQVNVSCLITDMNIPLGNSVGNALEVLEAIKVLRNEEEGTLKDLCIAIASNMVSLAKNISLEEAIEMVNDNLENGNAYRKFLELVKYQHGDINSIVVSNKYREIKSPVSGIITKIDVLNIGKLVHSLGAGRDKKDDAIDYGVGIVLKKHINDQVQNGDTLAIVYYNNVDLPLNYQDYFTIR